MPVEAYVRVWVASTVRQPDVRRTIKQKGANGTLPRYIGSHVVDHEALTTDPVPADPFHIVVGFRGDSRPDVQGDIDEVNAIPGVDETKTQVLWNDNAPPSTVKSPDVEVDVVEVEVVEVDVVEVEVEESEGTEKS